MWQRAGYISDISICRVMAMALAAPDDPSVRGCSSEKSSGSSSSVSQRTSFMDWEYKLDVVTWTLHVAVEVPVCYKQVEHEAGVRE